MNSTSLTSICGGFLLARAVKRWQQLGQAAVVLIAPVAEAFQGGAMTAYALAPATDRMVTDHDPIRLGPLSCRPPV